MFVIFVAVVTLVVEQETKPYSSAFLSAYCNVCSWQILLFSLYLLLLDAEVSGRAHVCMWLPGCPHHPDPPLLNET